MAGDVGDGLIQRETAGQVERITVVRIRVDRLNGVVQIAFTADIDRLAMSRLDQLKNNREQGNEISEHGFAFAQASAFLMAMN